MDYIIKGKSLTYFKSPPSTSNSELIDTFQDGLGDICRQKILELKTRYDTLNKLSNFHQEFIDLQDDEQDKYYLEVRKATMVDAEKSVVIFWIRYWTTLLRKAEKTYEISSNSITDRDIEEASQKPFLDVFDGELIPRGNRMVGICSFHEERTPSFTVFVDNNHAKCFGCDWTGDPIDYIQKHYDLSFVDAVRQLT